RRGDWAPRSVHRNARRISQAIAAVEARTGREALDYQVAEELGVDINEYFTMLQDANGSRLFSYEETFGEEDSNIDASETSSAFASPFEGLQREGLKSALAEAIGQLPERDRMVLALYYNEELNLKEIGLVLGVSESRVSQIHSQAAARLRNQLSDWHST
ncbi:MAG: sigma-70 family RNA polymerase sigma factor, partial [Moraxellaceae bacterium]